MRVLLALLRTEVILASRRGEGVLVTLVVPLALLVFFGAIAPGAVGARSAEVQFLVPGILALAVMSTSMVSLGIATAFERYYGVLKRLLGAPVPPVTLLLAKTLAVVLTEILQVATILLVATLALGWQPTGSILAASGVLLLGSVTFAGIGLLMAGTLRAEATLAVANGLYLLFLLVGGFVMPLEQLPAPIATVARLLPAAALVDAVRAALGQDAALLPALATLGAWAAVATGLAVATFRADT